MPSLSSEIKKAGPDAIIVGAGLAGSECAYQLLKSGLRVVLIEQRPQNTSEAHKTEDFAELVCSNSLKSTDPESAPGQLKYELEQMDSLILKSAYKNKVPAGQALAVDRVAFSKLITKTLGANPLLTVIRQELKHYEEVVVSGPKGLIPVVFATGPLSSESLSKSLQNLIGERLYFYDAIAPIVSGESINREIVFAQNRHGKGEFGEKSENVAEEGDYLNCPFSFDEYTTFIEALKAAEKVPAHDFEKLIYFQGCQPIEALLERGDKTLAFGPMKPVGLIDPRNDKQPYAVLQLRKEDSEGRAWNMVGFQTKLKYPEQERVFRLIPGLENAEFYRFGSLHRNTYINSPLLLDSQFRLKNFAAFCFAGQLTGVEGYLESTAVGALVGKLLAIRLKTSNEIPLPPPTTAIGALAQAIVNGRAKDFQPMNMNWGLVPLNGIDERDKTKKTKMISRARRNLEHWMALL